MKNSTTKTLAASLLLNLSVLVLQSQAGPGDVDLSFDSGSGLDGDVIATLVQPDGKLLIGGSFSTVKAAVRVGIARLNADGSVDTSFNPAIGPYQPTLYAIALEPDGKILVSGYFSTVNGTNRNYVARLNADGSLDSSFDPGTGLDRPVRKFAIQPDGRIIIGGWFSTVNGTSRNYVARLNADGSLDATFNPGTGANYVVDSIALQSDGKVIVGGRFTSFNGTARNRIVRLNSNGSVDTSFNPGTGSNSDVYAVALQADGKSLVAGDFTSFNGAIRYYVARLNTNGSLDTGFFPATTNIGRGSAIVELPGGKVFVGGTQFPCCASTRTNLVRLNSNGSLDSTFHPGAGVTTSGYAETDSIALLPDGKILLGGVFRSVNGTPQINLARLNTNGDLDISFSANNGVAGPVQSVASRSDGKMLVGGWFNSVNGESRNGIAGINADGTLDTSFDPGAGVGGTIAPSVAAVALQLDGKVVIGGSFTTVSNTDRSGIARLNRDGSLDGTFDPGTGADDEVKSLAVQADGKVIVGGWFYTFNGYSRSGIARLNVDGAVDTGFNPGLGVMGVYYSSVQSVALQSDNRMLIGGYFTNFDGTSRNGIARLDANGSLDNSFDPGTGFSLEPQDPDNPQNPQVNVLAIQPDGKVLVGGFYNTVNGLARTNIARLNTNGSVDSTFDPGVRSDFAVRCIALQPDGKVLVGGEFSTINGISRNGIARLNADGTLDTGFDPGAGAKGYVSCIALQLDGKIIIGGWFSAYNGVARGYLARLYGDPFPPSLSITRTNDSAIISWPVTAFNFRLEANTDLAAPDVWLPVVQSSSTNSGQVSVTLPAPAGDKFFRLKSN